MKAFVVLSVALTIVACARVEERGHWERSEFDHHDHHDSKHLTTTIIKKIPVLYPVEIEKHVVVHVDRHIPYPVEVEKKVPVHVPYTVKVPVYLEKNVTVHVDRPVPYPVEVKVPVYIEKKVHVDRPYPVEVEKKVIKNVPVHVDRPIPYLVKVPFPIDRPVPYPVEVKMPIFIEKKDHGHRSYSGEIEKKVPVYADHSIAHPVHGGEEVAVHTTVDVKAPINHKEHIEAPKSHPVHIKKLGHVHTEQHEKHWE